MYSVFDLETTTKTLHGRKASPFSPENYVVALGYKHVAQDEGKRVGEVQGEYYEEAGEYVFPEIPDATRLLVGHNIKFDLLHSWTQPNLQAYLKRGGMIWDTQLAEYLLAGQQPYSQMCAMDDIIENYGGTLKNDEVKAMWAAGMDTADIPPDLLMEYLCGSKWAEKNGFIGVAPADEFLEGDVLNTELIFLGQYRKAQSNGMLPAIIERMEALLATSMMEFNGVYVNRADGLREAKKLRERIAALDERLEGYIPKNKPEEVTFNWGNRYHLSPLLFGGTIKFSRWVQHKDDDGELLYASKTEDHYILEDGSTREVTWYEHSLATEHFEDTRIVFKAGKNAGEYKTKKVRVPDLTKPKGAQQDFLWRLRGFTLPLDDWKSSTPGLYSVSSDVIKELGERDIPFLKDLAQRQTLNKDLTTYYISEDKKSGQEKGMLTLIGSDGIVHHSLNHSLTVTTRLSSNNPRPLGL